MAKKRSRSRSASPVPTTPSASKVTPSTSATSKKKKRSSAGKAPKDPRTLADADSLERVPSALRGTVRTSATSPSEGELVVDRLRKEVCEKFRFSLSAAATTGVDSGENGPGMESAATQAVRTRLLVGTNACTRALESAAAGLGRAEGPKGSCPSAPSLAVLARDVRPPTALSHLPVLCRDVGTPLLLLPGKASTEFGRVLGVRSAAALLFLPHPTTDDDEQTKEALNCHRGIDSFVAYARSKIPM